MGNLNNCFVPENSRRDQYLHRTFMMDFTSDNFNEKLAKERLKKDEIDQVLINLKEHVGGF